MKRISLILSLFLFVSLPVHSKDKTVKPAQKQEVKKEISVSEAKKLWEAKKHIFIDVREDSEFAEVHIPGIKLINLGKLEKEIPNLSKNSKYVVMCRSGVRSMKATEIMKSKGFDVLSVKGGMLDWESKGYPVKK